MSERTAYHEAGHALIAESLGGEVRTVAIEPDKDDGPERERDTQVVWRRSQISEAECAQTTVQVCLAGSVVEMIHSGSPLSTQIASA